VYVVVYMASTVKRPGTTQDALRSALLGEFFEFAEVMGDLMARGLAERGLTRARAEVIWRLESSGPVTQRELADTLHVTPRNVTRFIDALEQADLVARGPHPDDRRASLLTLTPKGHSVAAALGVDHEAFAGLLFGDLEPTELETFVSTFERILAKLKQSAPGRAG
jgi:DNA-binding MarR family transcriptional regulator